MNKLRQHVLSVARSDHDDVDVRSAISFFQQLLLANNYGESYSTTGADEHQTLIDQIKKNLELTSWEKLSSRKDFIFKNLEKFLISALKNLKKVSKTPHSLNFTMPRPGFYLSSAFTSSLENTPTVPKISSSTILSSRKTLFSLCPRLNKYRLFWPRS